MCLAWRIKGEEETLGRYGDVMGSGDLASS